ncbi:hypothetical protein [Cohnella sp. 56]|uniref:hypothetical protein n=1 Tax=Cohnella sp. 56 TaxID=3113722 RepID=UPI0030E8B194
MKVPYSFSRNADLLLVKQTEDRVKIAYADFFTLTLPVIGPRPPYYANPRYVGNYPVI